MERLSTKDPIEREDDETTRLVRPAPKKKPPRRDTRREQVRSDRDSDVAGDPDLHTKDRSLNYKTVGASLVVAAQKRVPAVNKETGETVLVNPETIQEKPGQYEEVKEPVETAPEPPSGDQGPVESKPKKPKKEKKPKAEKGPADQPAPASEGEKSAPEGEKPKPQEPKPNPYGIKDPTRRDATVAERVEANYALAENLPAEIAADLIAQRIHPDDAKRLVNAYQAASSKHISDTKDFLSKMSGIYAEDPTNIKPPKTWETRAGKKVAFEELTPEEQADAYRQHQMDVLAMSLAAKKLIGNKIQEIPGIPRELVGSLASSLLGDPKGDVESETFDDVVEKGKHASVSESGIRRLLDLTQGNQKASSMLRGFLEANDYVGVKETILKNGELTEDDTPHVIAGTLLEVEDFFAKKAASYGNPNHTGAKRFEVQLLTQLKKLNATKHDEVRSILDRAAANRYAKAQKAYEKAKKEWAASPVQDRGEPPEPPIEPFGYVSGQEEKARRQGGQKLWQSLLGRTDREKTAATVAGLYLISSYLNGDSMARTAKSKEGLYLGIDTARNYPETPYRGWSQVQLRDLKDSDYQAIVELARGWLDNPALAGMAFDQQCRHALDLVAPKLDIQAYDRVLGQLKATAKTAGQVVARATERDSLEKKIYAKFPPDSRSRAGGKLQVMLEGDAASRLKLADYSTVVLGDLSPKELDVLASFMRVKTADTQMKLAHETRPNGEQGMKNVKANSILERLDKIAGAVQKNAKAWGMPFKTAKALVNALDKIADDAEATLFGESSFQRRQAELLMHDDSFVREAKTSVGEGTVSKAAAVLQRDPDEGYMDTFENPMAPIQTDADEDYMSAFEDDQSSAVNDGQDATGRELAP